MSHINSPFLRSKWGSWIAAVGMGLVFVGAIVFTEMIENWQDGFGFSLVQHRADPTSVPSNQD
jgi:hypothetical protein